MRVCILGWYGTETIGDRAILAGIISLLSEKVESIEIILGSLYPFYSERMIKEDIEIYNLLTEKNVSIRLFDSKNKKELKRYIKYADIVCIGGGPLMDLPELYMLKFAFKYAQKYDKGKYIYGCGIGPLFKEEYIKCVLDIVNLSDEIILRDSVSKKNLLKYAQSFNIKIEDKKIYTAFDPAVECAFKYKLYLNKLNQKRNIDIVINLREFPNEYSNRMINEKVNKILLNCLENISQTKRNIRLIPMHYFCIGNDDREFLSKLIFNMNNKKYCSLQNKPLSLIETMQYFYYAQLNIGMRFHSVVLQTILNGNNVILDYTEPGKGKINGFLKDIDVEKFYYNRYFCLQRMNDIKIDINLFDSKISEDIVEIYYKKGKDLYRKFNQLI